MAFCTIAGLYWVNFTGWFGEEVVKGVICGVIRINVRKWK